MELIDVEITTASPAHVTALELLEDFADAEPTWSYLEEDSRRYSIVRGLPGCVMQARGDSGQKPVEFVFVSTSGTGGTGFRIALIIPADADEPLTGRERTEWIARFLYAFRSYIEPRSHLVRLRRIEAPEQEFVRA